VQRQPILGLKIAIFYDNAFAPGSVINLPEPIRVFCREEYEVILECHDENYTLRLL
jgi:hypothetical protein